jgi:hypothetical protein
MHVPHEQLTAVVQGEQSGEAGEQQPLAQVRMAETTEPASSVTRREINHQTEALAMTADGTRARAEPAGHFVRETPTVSANAATVAGTLEQLEASIREVSMHIERTTLTIAKVAEAGVSAEAELGPQQVDAVLAATHGLLVAAQELKTAILRRVRGSAAKVDQRVFPRVALDLTCRVQTAGRAMHETQMVNLSEGGACFKKSHPLSIGSRGKLLISHLRTPVDFIVLGNANSEIRVAFASNKDSAAEIRKLLEQKGISGGAGLKTLEISGAA